MAAVDLEPFFQKKKQVRTLLLTLKRSTPEDFPTHLVAVEDALGELEDIKDRLPQGSVDLAEAKKDLAEAKKDLAEAKWMAVPPEAEEQKKTALLQNYQAAIKAFEDASELARETAKAALRATAEPQPVMDGTVLLEDAPVPTDTARNTPLVVVVPAVAPAAPPSADATIDKPPPTHGASQQAPSAQTGFPSLLVTLRMSPTSVPTEADHKAAEAVESSFGILQVPPLKQLPSRLWEDFRQFGRPIRVATEADIANRVRMAFEDVIREAGMEIQLHHEVELQKVRPDMYVVSLKGIVLGVVEVKKPGENAMTHPNVHGEVYDQLLHLRSVFGVKDPFGVLTTYQQWRVFWLPDTSSAEKAGATELSSPTEPYQTPVKNATMPGKTPSPPDITPSKRAPSHGCISAEGETEQTEENLDDRSVGCSGVFEQRENDGGELYGFIYSVLKKMETTTFLQVDLFDRPLRRAVRILTPDRAEWKYVTLPEGLCWDRYPPPQATRFSVWDDLGHGGSGRALLVASTGGAVCVLKLFYQGTPEAEQQWWATCYPQYARYVRIQKVVGLHALQMPHFAVAQRTKETLLLVRECLERHFGELGLVHPDVRWRNLGTARDEAGALRAVVFDLGEVRQRTADDVAWIDRAIDSLETSIDR